MAGTIEGNRKSAETLIRKYGEDYFRQLGRKGGSVKKVAKGFAAGEAGRERARIHGAIGGRISRPGKRSA